MSNTTIITTPRGVECAMPVCISDVRALGVGYLGALQGTGVSGVDHGKRGVDGGTSVSRTRTPFNILDVAPTLGRPPV